MPTAVLQSPTKRANGNTKWTDTTKTITHNDKRLYHEGGRTYEYIGQRAGNRIYRDTKPR